MLRVRGTSFPPSLQATAATLTAVPEADESPVPAGHRRSRSTCRVSEGLVNCRDIAGVDNVAALRTSESFLAMQGDGAHTNHVQRRILPDGQRPAFSSENVRLDAQRHHVHEGDPDLQGNDINVEVNLELG